MSAGNQPLLGLENFTLAFISLISASLIYSVFRLSSHGIDFTDEGFYLNWIANPSIYPASHTQFGFVYHPLYLLVGKEIGLLREANLGITLALAWILSWTCLYISGRVCPRDSAHVGAISLAVSSISLMILRMWIPTPSYNFLALQGLLILAIGLRIAWRPGWLKYLAGVLIGLGGWLTFMGKPTSAAVSGLVIAIWFYIHARQQARTLVAAAISACALFVAGAINIDGSVFANVHRLRSGLADAQLLQGRYGFTDILSLTSPLPDGGDASAFAIVLTLSFALVHAWERTPNHKPLFLTYTVALSAAVAAAFVLLKILVVSLVHTSRLGLLFFALSTGAVLARCCNRRFKKAEIRPEEDSSFVLILFLMPYIYVFGSNGDYWVNTTHAAIFPVLAAILSLTDQAGFSTSLRLPFVAASVFLAAIFLSESARAPYRQPLPLSEQHTPIQIGQGTAYLRISAEFAGYLENLADVCKREGFKDGTGVIDLTGHYPTAVFAIHGRALGLPWLCGGYRGSEAMALSALDRVARNELLSAWILLEPSGPRSLSADILTRYGINIQTSYIEIGSLQSPRGTYPESYHQILLRPRADLTKDNKLSPLF